MANIKSAKKRILVNETKAAQNKAFKTALKTACKKFKAAVEAGDKAAAEVAYKDAVVMTDKAVTRGLCTKTKQPVKRVSLLLP